MDTGITHVKNKKVFTLDLLLHGFVSTPTMKLKMTTFMAHNYDDC